MVARLIFAIAVSLMLSACATSTPPLKPPTRPQLDSSLAAPCAVIVKPEAPDYDVWELWAIDVLRDYGICAARHLKTVQAWPK